jgi:hypothetical protein
MAKRKLKEQEIISTPKDLQRSVGDITEEAYTLYGGYVATNRALPGLDGLKVSIRRLIYMAMQHPKGKVLPALDIISSVSRIHPHGIASLDQTAAHLKRVGVFDGNGSFGCTSIDGIVGPPAASRYLKIGLSNLYWDMLGDIVSPEYIGFHESPVGPLEPDSIPLPIAYCLYSPIQMSGIAVGVKTDIPSFSAKSILKAYKADDPSLLEPSVDLLIDKNNSELERLWRTGRGRVVYAYKISRQRSQDGKTEGILFESATDTSTEIFTPNLKKFSKLIEDGKVYTEDLTDDQGPKLFIGRVPGARGITIDDIESIARKICYSAKEYSCWVTDGTKAFRIPIKDWVHYTYTNYIELINRVNQKNIEKIQFQIAVQEALPFISQYLTTVNIKATEKELSEKLSLHIDVVKAALDKPIRQIIANKDNSDRIKSLKSKLKELKKFDPVKYTEEIINKL